MSLSPYPLEIRDDGYGMQEGQATRLTGDYEGRATRNDPTG